MKLVRNGLGQIEAAPATATQVPPAAPFTLTQYFLVAVAAGVTVYFLTRMLARRA